MKAGRGPGRVGAGSGGTQGPPLGPPPGQCHLVFEDNGENPLTNVRGSLGLTNPDREGGDSLP